MALTLRPAPAPLPAHPGRLRRAVTGPAAVLVAAASLSVVFLVLVSDLVARLG